MSKQLDDQSKPNRLTVTEYENVREAIIDELRFLNAQVKLYVHLRKRLAASKCLRENSGAFWNITLECYWGSIVFGVCKLLLDKDEGNATISHLIALTEGPPARMPNVEFRELKERVATLQIQFSPLRLVRNKERGHSDLCYVKAKRKVHFSYRFEELEHAVKELGEIANSLDANCEHMIDFSDLYDVDFPLDCLISMYEILNARDWKSVQSRLKQLDPGIEFRLPLKD